MITGLSWWLEEQRPQGCAYVTDILRTKNGGHYTSGVEFLEDTAPPEEHKGKSHWTFQYYNATIAEIATSTRHLSEKDKAMVLALVHAKYGVEL